jgi:WD domain, G-beta repeat
LSTGQERGVYKGHLDTIWSLDFSPDGRLLVTGGLDHTALVWDVTGVSPDGHWRPRDVPEAELERLWGELAGNDGIKAYRAVWSFAAARQGPSFLARYLPPVLAHDDKIAKLIADLDDERFRVREQATSELVGLGEAVIGAANKILASKPSLEVRQRLETVLAQVALEASSSKRLQALRAIEALENANSVDARKVLETLAGGVLEAQLTKSARESLSRWKK